MVYTLLLTEAPVSGAIPHQHKKQHPPIKLQVLSQGSPFNRTARFTPAGCASLLGALWQKFLSRLVKRFSLRQPHDHHV